MKLHIFNRQPSVFDPYAPYIKFVSVPEPETFQTGQAKFIFHYCRPRSRNCYVFTMNDVTIGGVCGGGGGCILKNAHHGQAVRYLVRESDLRVLHHLHSLGLSDLVNAVGKSRERTRQVPSE